MLKDKSSTTNHLAMTVVKFTMYTAGDSASYLYQETLPAGSCQM